MLLISILLSILILDPGSNPDGADTQKGYYGGFSGYGMSAFEDNVIGNMGQGSYIPTGLQFVYRVTPEIGIGAEFEFTGSMFSSSGEYADSSGHYFDEKYKVYMSNIGLIMKYSISDAVFLRGCIARYSGWNEYYDGYTREWIIIDLKSGIGFNLGGGYLMQIFEKQYIGIEGVYHIVSLEQETTGESYGFNHWAARLLLGMGF